MGLLYSICQAGTKHKTCCPDERIRKGGEVYLAEDARINQQVAIKVNRTEATIYRNSDITRDAVGLFQREARAIARLDHPHILPLFSYGEESVNGTRLIYIVMLYRHGG